ncbi:MAG: hypothetical protein MZW92_31490 [Comamonadaceae bacterium]|nr:hypothetical protein [Comamonadaceae bacterium]
MREAEQVFASRDQNLLDDMLGGSFQGRLSDKDLKQKQAEIMRLRKSVEAELAYNAKRMKAESKQVAKDQKHLDKQIFVNPAVAFARKVALASTGYDGRPDIAALEKLAEEGKYLTGNFVTAKIETPDGQAVQVQAMGRVESSRNKINKLLQGNITKPAGIFASEATNFAGGARSSEDRKEFLSRLGMARAGLAERPIDDVWTRDTRTATLTKLDAIYKRVEAPLVKEDKRQEKDASVVGKKALEARTSDYSRSVQAAIDDYKAGNGSVDQLYRLLAKGQSSIEALKDGRFQDPLLLGPDAKLGSVGSAYKSSMSGFKSSVYALQRTVGAGGFCLDQKRPG